MAQPVILCGLGKIGSRVLELLRAAALPVVVIDRHADPADPRWAGVRVINGDCRRPELLHQAGLADARGVLIVTSDDLVNTSAALVVRRLHPTVRIVVRMFNPNLLARLGPAVGNAQALSVSALTAPLLAQTALTGEVLGSLSAGGVLHRVARLTIASGSPLIGRRVVDVARERHAIPLAREPASGTPELLRDVRGESLLQAGDTVVCVGKPAELNQLVAHASGGDELIPGARFAGRLRRLIRVGWRALGEVDRLLLICAVVMFTVVISSSTIFHSTGRAHSLADGLYLTIKVIATGADPRADDFEGWQKVFVSVLRLFGTVLTAAFAAIFTNFLLRARLGGALEERRIPDSGHVVVCGLGNVGFRVVEELLQCGERVVVIERAADNPFVASCRRLGAAVVVGNAVVAEVVRQARVGTARAVIAATTDDLVNLEIALLAREMNPRQRVVVRLADEALGETLREVSDVRLALSLPALAAPAFVAALYGDRVQSLFRVSRCMLAAVELTVQPGDPCLNNQTLRALAIDYGLIPIAFGEWGRRLKEGETITAVAAISDLERLFRRQPAPALWAVQLTRLLAPTREQVALLVRMENGIGADEADALLSSLPIRVGGPKTRGQAEELRLLFERERASAEVIRA